MSLGRSLFVPHFQGLAGWCVAEGWFSHLSPKPCCPLLLSVLQWCLLVARLHTRSVRATLSMTQPAETISPELQNPEPS